MNLRVEEARKLVQEYEKTEEMATLIYWHKAKYTYFLKKDALWKYAVGEGAGTWGAFCAEILRCPTSTADHRVINYEFYVVKHNLPIESLTMYDAYVLYYIAASRKDRDLEEIQHLMEDSKVTARKDFLMLLQGKEDCEHPETHEEVKVVCDVCNKPIKK